MNILTMSNKDISSHYMKNAKAIIHNGSCYDFVKTIPENTVKLIIISPLLLIIGIAP
ncbi:MAG: hypothetical protein ACTTKH_03755 [Treponema sp.]